MYWFHMYDNTELDESLNSSLGLSDSLKVTGEKLTDEQRSRMEELLKEKSANTMDFEYESKHRNVLRGLRKEVASVERTGTF